MDKLSSALVEFFNLITAQFLQLWPYWVSGVLLGAVVKSLLTKSAIKSLLEASGRFSIPVGAVLGVLSPLCLFGALPLLSILARGGLSVAGIWAFLVASPLLNPNLFILTWGGIGPEMAFIRLAVALGMGILGGHIAGAVTKGTSIDLLPLLHARIGNPVKADAEIGVAAAEAAGAAGGAAEFEVIAEVTTEVTAEVTAQAEVAVSEAEVVAAAASIRGRAAYARRVYRDFINSLAFTGRYLAIGMAVAALTEMFVPTLFLMRLMGGTDNGFGVLFATGLGVPLYMCGGGSIPLVKQWMYVGGLSYGGAIAFMIAGPSTKVSNFAALIPALGKRGFAIYITLNMLGAVAVGYGVDIVRALIG